MKLRLIVRLCKVSSALIRIETEWQMNVSMGTAGQHLHKIIMQLGAGKQNQSLGHRGL